MRYLKLNHSILKYDHKYLYNQTVCNDRKYEFIKVGSVGHYRQHLHALRFVLIFQNYMNDDIHIRWGK